MPKPIFSKGSEFSREFSIGVVDTDKRTIELSFSSSTPIKRWGVFEVLEHGKDSVDLSRLNDSGAFLYNHDRNRYLGVIEPGSAKIDSDSKGRCLVRFSENDFAESIFRDVQSEILTKSSVTYRVDDYREETRDGKLHYVVTKWTPMEVSIVTVPADSSVGVGRSEAQQINPKNLKMPEEAENGGVASPPANPPAATLAAPVQTQSRSAVDVGVERTAGANAERERSASILKIGQQFNLGDLAQRAVADGMPYEQFKDKVLEEFEKRTQAIQAGSQPIGLSDEESRSFSFLKLLNHSSKPEDRNLRERAAFEIEACQAAADNLKHRSAKGGMIVPLDVLRTPLMGSRATDVVSIKAGAGYAGTGGNLVANTLLTSSFVDLLRDKTVFIKLARSMGGLVGNIDIPKQLTGPGGYWIGEDDDAIQDDITFGQLAMTPKTVANYGEVTRRMLMQTSMDVEALFRGELINGLAQTINLAGFYGDGTGNQPVGIKETNGINEEDFAGVDPTFPELVSMETKVASTNASTDNSAYVANSGFRGYAKTALKFAGIAGTLWEPGNSVNGYNTEITNSIANGDVFFGDFFEAIFGMWGGLEITADPYTHSTKGRLRVVTMQDVDILIRRPENFTYGAQLTP